MSFWDENKAKWLFQKLPFYNVFIKNPHINLIKEQDIDNPFDKIFFYATQLNELRYHLLIKKYEDAGMKHLNNSQAYIEYSAYMDDVYNSINNYNSSRKRKMLIV